MPLAGGPPVYKFCLEDGKGYTKTYCPCLDQPEQFLLAADVPSIGEGGGCQCKIVHVGKQHSSRHSEVLSRNVNEEKQRRDGGALRGPDIDGGQGTWHALEN